MSLAKKVGIAIVIFYVALGAAWFVRELFAGVIETAFWQVYVASFATVYGVYAGADAWQKQARSKYYHPVMDDDHPAAQQVALNVMKEQGYEPRTLDR